MYRIGEFAKLVNISEKTLRYYDEIGLFKPKYIDAETNYRYYDESQIENLNRILELKKLNIPLEEINSYIVNDDKSILKRTLDAKKNDFEQIEKFYEEKSIYEVILGDENDYKQNHGLNGMIFEEYDLIKSNDCLYIYIKKNDEVFCDLLYSFDTKMFVNGSRKILGNKIIFIKVFNTLFDNNIDEVIYETQINMDSDIIQNIEKYLIFECKIDGLSQIYKIIGIKGD